MTSDDIWKEAEKARRKDYPADDIFIKRWSPRALSGDTITDEELFTLFEAARWAPSSFNGQPWRFVYAKRDTPEWEAIYGLLTEGNKVWTKNAAVLVVVASADKYEYNGKPNRTHSFDTGSAWMSIALQASMMGLVAHGMSGFDYDRARKELDIPDDYTVEAMFAIGKPGDKEDLPHDVRKREIPSDRKKTEEFAFNGMFKGKNQRMK